MFDEERVIEFYDKHHYAIKHFLNRVAFIAVWFFFIALYLFVSTLEFHGLI